MTTPDPLPALLAPFHDHPERAGVFTDFDGTLSPIVDDPDAARPLPEAVTALARLADRFATVGVISGRTVDALTERLGLPLAERLFLAGLYGLEVLDHGRRHDDREAARWRDTIHRTAERAAAELPDGVRVEHKSLSLTLHFRTAPDHETAVVRWAEQVAGATALLVRPARMSVELHPPVERDKGTALTAAAEGLAAVCFLGDDVGDLPAFVALGRLAEVGVRTLRIGVRSAEAPPGLERLVDVFVEGPEGAAALLARLAQPAAAT